MRLQGDCVGREIHNPQAGTHFGLGIDDLVREGRLRTDHHCCSRRTRGDTASEEDGGGEMDSAGGSEYFLLRDPVAGPFLPGALQDWSMHFAASRDNRSNGCH